MKNKCLKIITIILSVIIGLAGILLLVLNIGKHIIYKDYYSIRKTAAKNPGLSEGFIPQGLTVIEDEGCFVTAGYMTKEMPSRLYKVDMKTNKFRHYEMTSNGAPFFGHTGGVQYAAGYIYLANESDGVYRFKAELLDDSEKVEIGSPLIVNNNSSFIFADETFLYVGEFNDDEKYKTDNHLEYEDKSNNAIVSKYKLTDLSKPVRIYSIPNQIQGFAVLENDTIVLSKSYGLAHSEYLIYKGRRDILETTVRKDGAKVYFLTEPTAVLLGPPMSEDLDVYEGKVVTLTESATNKYIFGKLLFETKINSLDIDALNIVEPPEQH